MEFKNWKENLFKLRWGWKNIAWIIITIILTIFLFLWESAVIPIPSLDIILTSVSIYLFGLKIDLFMKLVIIIVILLVAKTILTFLGGLIGETIIFLYKLIITITIFLPFSYLRLSGEFGGFSIEFGVSVTWITVIIMISEIISYIFTILSILDSGMDENEIATEDLKVEKKRKTNLKIIILLIMIASILISVDIALVVFGYNFLTLHIITIAFPIISVILIIYLVKKKTNDKIPKESKTEDKAPKISKIEEKGDVREYSLK